MVTINNEQLDQKIRDIQNRLQIIGLSAGIIYKEQLVWEGYYGLANINQKKYVHAQTVYRIASISKSILATALMQQYEKGKFNLNDDISDHLGFKVRNPYFPNTPITFTQLMTHTSSLQDEYVEFAIASYDSHPPSLKEILLPGGKFYKKQIWGKYEPGDSGHFTYSNLASIVVGTLVEILSGERFDLYCKKHIFEPLEMRETSFNIEDITLSELAVLYEYDPENEEFAIALDSADRDRPKKIDLSHYMPGKNGGIYNPQGGVKSTVRDLSKFLMLHMNAGVYLDKQILKPETVELMHQPFWQGTPKDSVYRKKGIHFQITEDLVEGKTVIGHSGNAYGLISGLYFNKVDELGIVFLTNGSKIEIGKLFYTIEEELASALYPV
ncbi:hypothetical protein GCM10008967_13010 [Bacillus carboniphilus]|uniref:Beta-lactamase-related domain-containing protein n=1 Tax=Bacillus carboniphilus TaxID=86663 RepID=A0ABN0W362_9BACI